MANFPPMTGKGKCGILLVYKAGGTQARRLHCEILPLLRRRDSLRRLFFLPGVRRLPFRFGRVPDFHRSSTGAKQGKEPRPRKPRKSKHPKEEKPRRTFALPPDYDGYYGDVKPIDAGLQREGVDTRLILRVALLVVGVALGIGGCVLALFLL